MLLALTLLLSLAVIDVEGHYTCTFKYSSVNNLPSCFFLPYCGLNNQLASGFNTYKRVYTSGNYRYYGLSYNKLTVDVSGYLLFGHGSLPPIYPFYSLSLNKPKCQRYDLIGVYWAAHDTRWCGKVCYDETISWWYRLRFRNLVDRAFSGTSGFAGFWPTHLFMVTYFNVDSLYKPCCRPFKRDAEERIEERRGKKGNKLNAEDDEEEPDDDELDKGYGEAAELEDEANVKGKLKEDAGDREEPDNKAADSDKRPDVAEPKVTDPNAVHYYHGLNTYQIVMGTNGVHTYAVLIYMTRYKLWTDHKTRQMAGFWTRYSFMKYTYAFRWSWTDYLYFVKYYGYPLPYGGCSTYVFRLDPFSWPFIKDPKSWMTKYGYRACY